MHGLSVGMLRGRMQVLRDLDLSLHESTRLAERQRGLHEYPRAPDAVLSQLAAAAVSAADRGDTDEP